MLGCLTQKVNVSERKFLPSAFASSASRGMEAEMAVFHFYCDESCQDRKLHDYLALGGILTRKDDAQSLSDDVARWRAERNMTAELKFTKISGSKLSNYQEYASFAINAGIAGKQWFQSLISKNEHIDYRQYHGGSEALGRRKFTYDLIVHKVIRLMGDGDTLCVFPDKDHYPLDREEFKAILNSGIRKKFGFERNEVTSVVPVDSKNTNIGQMNDLLLGCVASAWNRPEQGGPKRALRDYVASGLAIRNLASEIDIFRFGVWQYRLQQRKEKSPLSPTRMSVPQSGFSTLGRGFGPEAMK